MDYERDISWYVAGRGDLLSSWFHWLFVGDVVMTEYHGQRISDLMAEMERLTAILDTFNFQELNIAEQQHISRAYSQMAIMKAKLTALQGEK